MIAAAILLSGWAIYHTACFLVEGYGDFSVARQQRFNTTLFQYLVFFGGLAVIISAAVQYYFTKRLIRPINQLIASTKMLKKGTYPDAIDVRADDEIGELIQNYNELQKQLQHNEEYRKKLVADVSHELRTPIANLTGYMHALKSGVIEGDQELFTALHEQTNRLANLVEQIEHLNEWEDTTSNQPLMKEIVQIRAVTHQSVELFSWKLKAQSIEVDVEIEESELNIHSNGIQQVLTNLLDNAIQYYEGEAPISITGKRENADYVISIASPGKEIMPEEKELLFERFYRVDHSRARETGGTGLGLAIVKEIIDNHQGTIEVQSNDGINTFIIFLPR